MRLLTALPQDDLRDVADFARAAEAAGYHGLTTAENKHDPFLGHAIAAIGTERVALITSVAIAFPRSPMVVANACWDLQTVSRGRFVLGLGPQIRPHNERRFSVPWSAPAPRLRDYVHALRAIWTAWETGAKLNHVGPHYRFTLMPPYFVPPSRHLPMVPVTLAAVGPHTLRLAGEVADGVRLHGFCTRAYLDAEILPRLAEGFARTGAARARFEITGGGFVATGADDAAVARAIETVRGRIAFYGSTQAYWPVLELHGLGELGRKLNAMTRAGQWSAMAGEIADDVVALFAAIGRHDELPRAIADRFGPEIDAIALPPDLPPDLLGELAALPTKFQGVRAAWPAPTA